MRAVSGWIGLFVLLAGMPALLGGGAPQPVAAEVANLIKNPDFETRGVGSGPANYQLSGDVEYRFLGNPRRDFSSWGVALQSGKDLNGDGVIAGSVAQTVTGLDARQGRWFRFSFRGMPQDNFAVAHDNLEMKVEFFGGQGKISYDLVTKKIYPLIELDRKNLSVNGDRKMGGAAVWRTYEFEFHLPFPQVDQVKVGVGFRNGAGLSPGNAAFYVDDFSLVRIADPASPTGAFITPATAKPAERVPLGTPLPLGGRWYYDAKLGETIVPKIFDYTNAARLLYHDARWSAPFEGNMTAWLRAGFLDLQGNLVTADRFVPDNVTVSFDEKYMIVHAHNLPNHPTARFPEIGFGNPSHIQEENNTYYIPLNPQVNPNHVATTLNNSNHALNMGPIGIAINGVVFFNPFDANSMDASDLMDRCCGHPNPMNQYHYHKYPICVKSPWADEGTEHSPIIGWAFDGFPVYGPYASAGVMAKDVTGDYALNDFNMHYDKDRGWHYQVTPGKFPYIIGGYWGVVETRNLKHLRGPPGGFGGGPGGNGRRGPPPEGFGPGPDDGGDDGPGDGPP